MIRQSPHKRVLIVDDDPTIRELLRVILANEGYEVTHTDTAEAGYDLAIRQLPQLAIIDVVLPGMNGYTLCRKLRQNTATHAIPILMLTAHGDVSDKIAGFEAGADDYLVKPFNVEELTYRVKNLLARADLVAGVQAQPRPRGQVIALFGTKGGVGKTTIAVNMCIAIRKITNKRVALFDADFYFGDVGLQLNLPLIRSALDLIERIDVLDPDLIEQVVMPHPSGIRVLLSPHNREKADLISAEHVRRLLNFVAQQYDYVVVDTHPSYDDRTLAVLEEADQILLVVTPEIGSLVNTNYFLEIVNTLGITEDKILILLNRARSNVGIETMEIERTLSRRITYNVMSAGRPVVQSVNRGVPLMTEQPNHPFSQQITQIAEALLKYHKERVR